ncbi:MAG: PucR family transcriptional regulator ligand-binding domain-containing protein [Chloroflexi bacterium]|nr:PucR family transcriptional regulator ligand-binding domain-containing protein [Chloroflexota bacterium]MCY4247332.1 PucR family transcriptional regulator ligand-binding domain-containing protein [Chloroflexota bacterium]
MLTLEEALQSPILNQAKVVAGAGGLARAIRWVHIVNVPNMADWLHGGELVLTTVLNMPAGEDAQREFLRQLAARGIVAVVITTGLMVDEIPEHLRALGDKLGLPLIELPYQTRFVDIAKIINERIAQANLDTLSRALSIQQQLSRLVLEGGGFVELANMLAEQVGHSISIENERFEAIASKNIAAVDSARRYTIEHGRTNPQLIDALEGEYLPRIRATLRPVQLPVMPALGLEMERLLAPIVVHSEIYGYMWIIADVQALTPIDMMAIEIGATVAALLMLHRESLAAAEASLKGSFVAQLIEAKGDPQSLLSDQALRYGVDLRLPWRMLLVSLGAALAPAATRAYRVINRVVAQRGAEAVAAQFAGQVVILAQDDANNCQALAAALLERLEAGARIGISGVCQGAQTVGDAHQQCADTLIIGRKIQHAQRLHHFDALGYIHTLYQAGASSLSRNAQAPLLRRLQAEQQADLFNTLEVYLDAGGNSVQTAQTLCIHRSTLNYRLARIREVCAVDLSAPVTRLDLQVALKLMRLFDDTD